MKINNFGFTLVELIIGMAISVILMGSIGLFVTNGIKNISVQKKVLDSNSYIGDFYSNLGNIFGNDFKYIGEYDSGILLKSNFSLGNGNFTYLGTKTFTGECGTGNSQETKYLLINSFTPFEGTTIVGNFNTLSGSHNVFSGSEIVVGKSIFGDNFNEGDIGTGVFLNNPTGLTFGDNKLFISDSGNDRILYLSGSRVYKLLDENDGISNPTGLYFSTTSLFIANTGKNEILKYEFGNILDIISEFQIKYKAENNFTGTGFDIELFNGITLDGTYNTGSFSFIGFSTNIGDIATGSLNKLTYSFSGTLPSFNSGSIYTIKIPTLSGSFTNTGNYYTKLSIYSGGNIIEKYFPYFTQGDDDITTKSDNILSILTGGLNYPTGVSNSGGNLVINNFINREWDKITNTGSFVDSGSLVAFNPKNLTQNLSKFKIKDFKYQKNGNLLTIIIEYYKNFSCENSLDNVVKTIIYKKSL